MTTQAEGRLTKEQIIGLKDCLLGHRIPPCTQEQWRYVCDLALRALSAPSEARETGLEEAVRVCLDSAKMNPQSSLILKDVAERILKRTAAPARVLEAERILKIFSELEVTDQGVYTNAGKVMRQMARNYFASQYEMSAKEQPGAQSNAAPKEEKPK